MHNLDIIRLGFHSFLLFILFIIINSRSIDLDCYKKNKKKKANTFRIANLNERFKIEHAI
jgi:hypothetical protein